MPAQNTQPYQIVAGAADIYYGTYGLAFPAYNAQPGTAWVYMGHTDGGITINHQQTVVELRTDQVTAPVKAVRSEEGLEVTFSLAQVSAENYALSLNQVDVNARPIVANAKAVNLYTGGFGVRTFALLVRGTQLSPEGPYNMQYEVPAVYQSGTPSVAYTKDAKALLAISLMAIAPAAFTPGYTDDQIFGVLRVGTA